MVNVSGLQRRSTYEEVAKLAEADVFRSYIKTPDRLPKIILDAPSLTALDPDNEEALIQFEKNKRLETARRSEAEEVAQQRGVSRAQLELATRPARPQLVEPTADYERQRWEISLAEAAANFSVQSARAQNLERVRTLLRQHLVEQNRQTAEVRLGQEAEFFDITTPPEQEIELHFPDAPRSESFRTAAGSLARMAGGAAMGGASAAVGGAAAAAPLVARAAVGGAVAAAPLVARTIDSAGPQAINLLAGAARLTRDYGPTIVSGTATGAGMMIRGVVTGGQIAAGTSSAAAELAQALTPASHRGRDFMQANGARFAPSLARLMAEHHGNMF